MLKNILCLAVLVSVSQTSPPLPRQAPNASTSTTKKHNKKTTGGKGEGFAIPPALVSGPSVTGAPSQNGPQNQADINEGHSVAVTKLPSVSVDRDWIDRTTLALGIGLLLVGGFGVWAALRTLNAIRRQIDLQERTMQQWVDLADWRSRLAPIPSGKYGPDGNSINIGGRLTVQVDVVNPTNFPVTLPGSEIRFTVGPDHYGTFYFRDDCRLTPKNKQTASLTFNVNEFQSEQFLKGELWIRVDGNLSYVGVLGKIEPHRFGGTLRCSNARGTEFAEETLENTTKQEPEGQNPN